MVSDFRRRQVVWDFSTVLDGQPLFWFISLRQTDVYLSLYSPSVEFGKMIFVSLLLLIRGRRGEGVRSQKVFTKGLDLQFPATLYIEGHCF